MEQPPTSAVKRPTQSADRLEWNSHASDSASHALGERSGMGVGRRGRQTTPRRTARGIDVEVAALRQQRQVSADFAGSVEDNPPRDPPASRDWDAAKCNRADAPRLCRAFGAARSLRFCCSMTSVRRQKRGQTSPENDSTTPVCAGRLRPRGGVIPHSAGKTQAVLALSLQRQWLDAAMRRWPGVPRYSGECRCLESCCSARAQAAPDCGW